MNIFRLEKLKKKATDTSIKGIKNLFRLEKQIKVRICRDIRNLLRPEKENKGTKDKIIRDIKNIFKNEEEKNDYKPVRISRFWSNNYIQYKSSSDINKRISDEEYLNKIQSCIKDIINNLKESDMWKTQLTTAINFIISIDNHE